MSTRSLNAMMAAALSGLFLILTATAHAQPDAGQGQHEPPQEQVEPDPRLVSPRQTMSTFIDAIDNLAGAGVLSLAGAEPDQLGDIAACFGMPEIERAKLADYAAALAGVLYRAPKPRDPDLPDARRAGTLGSTFVFLPHESDAGLRTEQSPLTDRFDGGLIAFTRDDIGQWTFSAETLATIEQFHAAVKDLPRIWGQDERALSPSLWLESIMPRSLSDRGFLGLAYWKWIGLLVIVLVGAVIDQLIRALLRALWRRFVTRRGGEVDPATLRRAVVPFGLLASAVIWLLGLSVLGLPETVLSVLLLAVRVVLVISAVWAGFRVVDLGTEFLSRRAIRTNTRIDDLLVPLLRKTLKIFIFALGLIYIADSLHINVIPLLTGLSIGGLAVAIAAKDTIENFFGSVAVIVDRPFEVGDWVVIGDVEGTVEHLGFRSTRIRTFYNSLVTMPNAMLVRTNVDNYGRRKYRRVKAHISITYDTPPDRIEAFCEGIRELVRTHPHTRKDYYQVWLHQFGAASLDILLYVFHEAPDWSTELRERERLFLDIIRLANRLGVEFAFPTQTLYMRRDQPVGEGYEPRTVLPYDEEHSKRHGRRAVHEIIAGAHWSTQTPGPVTFPGPQPPSDDEDSEVESRSGGDA